MRALPRIIRAGLTGIVLWLSTGAGIQAARALGIGGDDFIASPAAEAFRAGEFEAALAGFEAMLGQYPDDLLILRYIGIANDRLGRYEAARQAFLRALAVEPDDLATRFYLGITEYKDGDNDAAAENFREVAQKGAGTKYAERAQEFLAAIRADDRPWTARLNGFAQAGAQYDANVPEGPDGGGGGGTVALLEYLRVGYALVDTPAWQIRVEGDGYLSQHTEGDADGFDLQQAGPAIDITHATTLAGVPLLPGVRYAYRKTFLSGDGFSDGHSVAASLATSLVEKTVTRLSYQLSVEDFEDEGRDPGETSRDAVGHGVGVTQSVYLLGRDLVLSFGYSYGWSDADGDNFDARSHDGTLGLSAWLPAGLTLELSGAVGRDDYPDFAGPRQRRTNRYTAAVALAVPIWERLKASLSYKHSTEDSNYSVLDIDRDIVTLVVGYGF